MDDAARAEMKRISEQVAAVNQGGGSTNKAAVQKVADDAAATVIQKGTNDQGQPIYFIGPAKHKGGPIHKKAEMMGGGMYKSKKHSYATGGMVKDMKLMRKK
tara:strand:- start:755 stop:1060 length:306 start_codon:yes stop_codon:yes gene_type:complete